MSIRQTGNGQTDRQTDSHSDYKKHLWVVQFAKASGVFRAYFAILITTYDFPIILSHSNSVEFR